MHLWSSKVCSLYLPELLRTRLHCEWVLDVSPRPSCERLSTSNSSAQSTSYVLGQFANSNKLWFLDFGFQMKHDRKRWTADLDSARRNHPEYAFWNHLTERLDVFRINQLLSDLSTSEFDARASLGPQSPFETRSVYNFFLHSSLSL